MIAAAASHHLQCTGRKQPIRSSWAMPQASLRSVLTTIAESAAFTWRVSSSTVAKPVWVNPAYSHCDRGPASNPMRTTGKPSLPKKRAKASDSLTDSGKVLHGCPLRMHGADPLGPRFSQHHSGGSRQAKPELGGRPIAASHGADAPDSGDGEISIDQSADGTPGGQPLQPCGSGDGAIADMDARPPG